MDSEDDSRCPELESNRNRDQSGPNLDTEEVRVFLPSAWAKIDVSTSVVFDAIYPTFEGGEYTPSPLDKSDIVRHRKNVTSSCDYIFVEHNGKVVQTRPKDEIETEVMDAAPSFSHNYCVNRSEDSYRVIERVIGTWVVGSDIQTDTDDTSSFGRAIRNQAVSLTEKAVMMRFSNASRPVQSSEREAVDVITGDICTLLRPERGSGSFFAVLVHRYWKQMDGLPSIVLLWIECSSCEQTENRELCSTPIIHAHNVRKVRIQAFSSERSHQRDSLPTVKQKPFGRLANGKPFVVYRILLHCDDFQKSQTGKSGSAGGCYFLPLSMPVERRLSTSSVRIISLTPPEVSTNEVLRYIVTDLVQAGIHGIDGHTPSGGKVRIFVDVLGLVGDYSASAAVVDVIEHVGRSPCTICSFRRLQDSTTEGSKFGYTTKVHSNHSSFLRHGERHIALRRSDLEDSDANTLGMVPNHRYRDRECPLLYLQRELESQYSRCAVTEDETPVTSCNFDAYRNNLIAPDHLLTGVSKDILNATFQTLPTAKLREETDIRMCVALRTNGLLPQNQLFNSKTNTIHSMTLSETFWVLCLAVSVLTSIVKHFPSDHNIQECFKLLHQIQSLIAYTYWWPEQELDGWVYNIWFTGKKRGTSQI